MTPDQVGNIVNGLLAADIGKLLVLVMLGFLLLIALLARWYLPLVRRNAESYEKLASAITLLATTSQKTDEKLDVVKSRVEGVDQKTDTLLVKVDQLPENILNRMEKQYWVRTPGWLTRMTKGWL